MTIEIMTLERKVQALILVNLFFPLEFLGPEAIFKQVRPISSSLGLHKWRNPTPKLVFHVSDTLIFMD